MLNDIDYKLLNDNEFQLSKKLIANSEGAKNIQSILPEVFVIGEIQERNGNEQVIFV